MKFLTKLRTISMPRLIAAGVLLSISAGSFLLLAATRGTADDALATDDLAAEEMADRAGVRESTEEEEELDLLYQEIPVTTFRVGNISPMVVSDMDYVDWFYSEWEDCRYLFLPATADRTKLTLTWAAEGALTLNGKSVTSGSTTDLFSTADTFEIKVGNTSYGELRVMQSNLGCMYVNTAHGGLDYLDQHNSITETGSTLILDADGTIQYSGALGNIKRHGNSSWDYSPLKHPYNFKLPEKANLYGMGKAKKWVLLSNFLDFSMLRNSIAFHLAEEAGIPYTPDYTYIDLFSDGSYRGTYQLTERVQIQKQRVNITDLEEETEAVNLSPLESYTHVAVGTQLGSGNDRYVLGSYKYYDIPNNPADITGGYLLQFQMWNRYGGHADSGFVTSRGQAIEVKCPEAASEAQVLYIREFVQDLEDAIYSETGYNAKGKHYSDYIDVDSLILYYLVEEVTMDGDGTFGSFYLYKETDAKGDGKLHCAPVWDFDLSMNNYNRRVNNGEGGTILASETDRLFIPLFPMSGWNNKEFEGDETRQGAGLGWIGTLYKRPDFAKRSAELYFEHFDKVLQELVDTSQEGGALITRMSEQLYVADAMNNAKTHMYGGKKYRGLGPNDGETYPEIVDFVRDFLERRRNGLRAVWLEDFAEVRSSELEQYINSLPLGSYDKAEFSFLETTLNDAVAAMKSASDMDAVQAFYDDAVGTVNATPRAHIAGDFNDDKAVDIKDAQSLLMHYAKELAGLTDAVDATQKRNGDVDGNGVLNALDSMHILRYASEKLSGREYTFPQ